MRDEKDKVWAGNTHEITTARSNSADNAISATFCSGMSMTVQSTRSYPPFSSLDLFPVPTPAPSKHPCKSKYEYAARGFPKRVDVINQGPNENRSSMSGRSPGMSDRYGSGSKMVAIICVISGNDDICGPKGGVMNRSGLRSPNEFHSSSQAWSAAMRSGSPSVADGDTVTDPPSQMRICGSCMPWRARRSRYCTRMDCTMVVLSVRQVWRQAWMVRAFSQHRRSRMFSRSSLGRLSRDTGIVVVIVPWNAQLWVVCVVSGSKARSARVTHPRDCQ